MKNRILLAIVASLILAPFALAGAEPPAAPETGSTLGAFAVAGLALIALRRKLTK